MSRSGAAHNGQCSATTSLLWRLPRSPQPRYRSSNASGSVAINAFGHFRLKKAAQEHVRADDKQQADDPAKQECARNLPLGRKPPDCRNEEVHEAEREYEFPGKAQELIGA